MYSTTYGKQNSSGALMAQTNTILCFGMPGSFTVPVEWSANCVISYGSTLLLNVLYIMYYEHIGDCYTTHFVVVSSFYRFFLWRHLVVTYSVT